MRSEWPLLVHVYSYFLQTPKTMEVNTQISLAHFWLARWTKNGYNGSTSCMYLFELISREAILNNILNFEQFGSFVQDPHAVYTRSVPLGFFVRFSWKRVLPNFQGFAMSPTKGFSTRFASEILDLAVWNFAKSISLHTRFLYVMVVNWL